MSNRAEITSDYLAALGDPSAQGAYVLRLLAAVLDTGMIELSAVERFVAAYQARKCAAGLLVGLSEYQRMDLQRQSFLRAWRIWLTTHLATGDIEDEIHSTGSAIRQIAELGGA